MTDGLVTSNRDDPTAQPRARHVVHDITRRMPVRARPPGRREPDPSSPPITIEERPLVDEVMASLRPTFQAEGGDVELVEIRGATLVVRLDGVCADCGAAPLSLAGLQFRLSRALGRRISVRPVVTSPGARS